MNIVQTVKPKCSACKHEFTPEVKPSGKIYKTCRICLEKVKERAKLLRCEHGRTRTACKECGGSQICEHGRMRSKCKECGGASICEHGRVRCVCKECIGGNVCEHGRQRNICKECGGASICEHGRVRCVCKECEGGSICEHGRVRSKCKECRGSQICEHGREKTTCKECGGSQICEHGRMRSGCKECGGGSICEHGRVRSRCRECGGGTICKHNKQRYACIICTPKRACQNCKSIYVAPSYRFHPFCFRCYCVLNPDEDIPKKYKLKEHYLRDTLKETFTDTEMIFDKSHGSSGKRPDVLINCDTYNIIVECDEDQHKNNYGCECRRTMEIFQDLQDKPLVMIRFNPDFYIEKSERKVPSCFNTTKTSGWKIDKREWKRRTNILIEIVQNFMENPPEKELTYLELFYNEI